MSHDLLCAEYEFKFKLIHKGMGEKASRAERDRKESGNRYEGEK